MRAGKPPFSSISAEETLATNVIGNNSGNLLFQFSAYKMFCGKTNSVDLYGYKHNPTDADWINEQYDAFVLPLANAFRKSYLPQLKGYTDLIEKLKIPVVVLSVGAQADIDSFSKLNPVNEQVTLFCKAVLKRSATIGVRGEFTKDYLNKLGFSDVEVIGCPSMFTFGNRLPELRQKPLGKYSKISINATENVLKFAEAFALNVRRYKYLSYIPQNISTLKALLNTALSDLECDLDAGLPDNLSHPVYHFRNPAFFLDISTWLDFMRTQDFSFGTRIHGNIISLLSGTPAHVIAHDSRTLELARYFEIPHTTLTANTTLEDLTAERLFENSDYTGYFKNHHKRFDVFNNYLQKSGLRPDFSEAHTNAFFGKLANIEFPAAVVPSQKIAPEVTNHQQLFEKISKLGTMIAKISKQIQR